MSCCSESTFRKKVLKFLALLILVGGIVYGASLLCSCTLSLSTVATHGHASDIVDDQDTTNPVISPTIAP